MFKWPNIDVLSVIIFTTKIKRVKNLKNFLMIGDVQYATHRRVVMFYSSEESKDYENEDTTVSDIMIEQMAELGLRYVFGIPGTSILGVVDAIKKE